MKGATLKTTFDTILMMVRNGETPDEIKRYMDAALQMDQSSALVDDILACNNCDLCKASRVPGEGNIHSPLMLIGEGPGEQEDIQKRPFVGPAGQLLDKIIEAAGWDRRSLYLTNVVKCRAHDNGKIVQPNTAEIAACVAHLRKEIEVVKPEIIICLGAVAANTLIHPKFRMTEEHGIWFEIEPGVHAIAIYHPSYILRKGEGTEDQEEAKAAVWDDIQKVIKRMEEMGL